MNVLFLMILPIDIKNSPNLYTDLMEEFRDRGHLVYGATIKEKKYGEETKITETDGINILQVKTGNMFGVGAIEKGITTLSLESKFKKAINTYFNHVKFDLVIMPTPPITFAKVVNYIKLRDNAKSYLILRDIFPQNAKDIGLIKNNMMYNFFRRKEKYMYHISDRIGCMSQGNIDYVKKYNPEVSVDKLELLPNWIKLEDEKENLKIDFKEKYGLTGKIVCVFGGNIGWPQELTFLLELAKAYKYREDLIFLIIGKGVLKDYIEKEVINNNLSNVIIRDFIPRDDYEGLLKQCDIGLINLDRRFTIPNIPSKTVGYFAVELPILASVDKNTDYGKILEDAKAGLWSVTGDLESYKANLQKLLSNESLRKEMGRNGRKYLEKNWTVQTTYNRIMEQDIDEKFD
ncbi:glycosyltransferase family 4 protein [Anaerovorax odorimutans]|uniref:glycosyltransferase family 4 protein n=1 Tax=Anaerovorax odorimutans TaxID=109327 RepID=UPI0003F9927C|nr:glycosyltransferase family 4 protein [Anaerovorax odorimutans]